jgi:hypothetical protein
VLGRVIEIGNVLKCVLVAVVPPIEIDSIVAGTFPGNS